MGRYGSLDHAAYAKYGVALGVTLLAAGALGELAGTALFGDPSGLEATLMLDLEILGTLLALLSPLVFGIVLPLVE